MNPRAIYNAGMNSLGTTNLFPKNGNSSEKDHRRMARQNDSTREIAQEISTRCEHNPQGTFRIGTFGFIELEDTWGDETTILNTARVSTSNKRLHSPSEMSEKDLSLLYHLFSEQHGTPFETVLFRYRFIAPIFVLRQWVKHRISTWNEFSMRYRKPISAFYIPSGNALQVDGFPVLSEKQVHRYTALLEELQDFYEEEYDQACQNIEEARKKGVIPENEGGRDPYRARARELLRGAVPVAAYSDVYWTVNLRSLLNFFSLRTKETAQYEIREYALAAYTLFGRKFPIIREMIEKAEERKQ